jgi:hypothetical protein
MRLWRQVQGLLQLLVEGDLDEAAAPEALKTTLARSAGCVDFAALKADMDSAAARVRRIYKTIVDRPAAEAREDSFEETGR